MRVRLALVLGAITTLALAAVAIAAPSQYKVTGGGQVFAEGSVGDDGKPTVKGPGDTITFNAFITPNNMGFDPAAEGKVNIIDRPQDGSGQSTTGKGVHYQGTVTCAFIAPESSDGRGYAELYGTARMNSDAPTPFVVRIQDNGQGSSSDGNDLVEFDYKEADPDDCDGDSEEDENFDFNLARGNAKIHKESSSQSSQRSAKTTQSTSLTSALSALR